MQLLESMANGDMLMESDDDVTSTCVEAMIESILLESKQPTTPPAGFFTESKKVFDTIYKWAKVDSVGKNSKVKAKAEKALKKQRWAVMFPAIRCSSDVKAEDVFKKVKSMGYKQSQYSDGNLRTRIEYFVKEDGKGGLINLVVTASKYKSMADKNEVAFFTKYIAPGNWNEETLKAFNK